MLVRTDAGQTKKLALHGGTAVKLAQSTLMTVTPQTDGVDRPALEKGDASFSVPHQAAGHNFSVMAGPYRIVVIGTKFRLHVEGIKVAVAVDEGVVEVWRKHRLVRLATGDSWSSPYDRSGVPAEGSANGPAEPQVASPDPPPPAPAPPAPAPAPAVIAPPPAAAAVATPPDPMQEAKAALAAGDPNRALDFYRAAITRGGPTAETPSTRSVACSGIGCTIVGRDRDMEALSLVTSERPAARRYRRLDHRSAGGVG